MPYFSYFFHFSFHLFPDSGLSVKGHVILSLPLSVYCSLLCTHRFPVTLHPTIILALAINPPSVIKGLHFLSSLLLHVHHSQCSTYSVQTRLNIWLLDKFSMSPLLCFVLSRPFLTESKSISLKPSNLLKSLCSYFVDSNLTPQILTGYLNKLLGQEQWAWALG